MPKDQTPITPHEAAVLVCTVQQKIARYTESRRIAEEAFDKLKARPDWERICELTRMSPSSDFGDWTC